MGVECRRSTAPSQVVIGRLTEAHMEGAVHPVVFRYVHLITHYTNLVKSFGVCAYLVSAF